MYHQVEVLTLGKEAVSSNALQESPAGRRAYSPTPVVFGPRQTPLYILWFGTSGYSATGLLQTLHPSVTPTGRSPWVSDVLYCKLEFKRVGRVNKKLKVLDQIRS